VNGMSPFGPFEFHVNEDVLIPRSFIAELLVSQLQAAAMEGLRLNALDDDEDTQQKQLVEAKQDESSSMQALERDPKQITGPMDVLFANVSSDIFSISSVLDWGTGSGCLAVMAAAVFPNAAIDAVDISAKALQVAQRNIDKYEHISQFRISLHQGDGIDAVPRRRKYDLILCNPPYVTSSSLAEFPPEFRHEPVLALDGSGASASGEPPAARSDGLGVIRRVLNRATKRLSERGVLLLEVAGHDPEEIEALLQRRKLPFTWLPTHEGEHGNVVAVLRADAQNSDQESHVQPVDVGTPDESA